MPVIPLLLALWLAMDVQGTTTCPTPSEVSQHLLRVLPEAERQAGRATLSSRGESIDIELDGPDGGLWAERQLDRAGSCAEMAEAVSVILAAWQAKFNPTVSPTGVPLTGVSAPPPTVGPPEAEPAAPKPLLFDAGIAALTSMVGSDVAYGAKLEGTLSPFAHGLGFHLALSGSSNHTQTIATPPLTAKWLRPALGVGPNLRLQGASSALDLHGDAVLAILHVTGSGLSKAASDTTMGFGLAAGLRGLWTWTKLAVWVGADLLGFPGQDNLTVGNYGQVGRLPHVEIQVSLGVAWGRFR